MRPIWSGALSFGLINIPVNLYSGTEEHALSFDMLHKTDLSPIRFARICKEDGKEIPYKDIVKGYEYAKGEYVVVTEDDFKQANLHKTTTIEIYLFAEEQEVDMIYFDKPYFLEPAKKAEKPYALLREALQRTKKVGVAKYVFRNREHLGIIKPYQELLVLNQLRFASEIRDMDVLKAPAKTQINKKELDMATKLVNQLTDKFNIEDYKDSYSDELMEIINKKIKGISPRKKAKVAPPSSKVHDIMSLLKESLEETTPSKTKSKKTRRAK